MKSIKFLFLLLVMFASCGKDNGKQEQTISFDSLSPCNLSEGSFTLSATASSGLPVTFTSDNSSIASINGNTLTPLKKGIVNITASQAGNDEYFEAPKIVRMLVVNEDNDPDKKNQTIAFELSVGELKFGEPDLTLEATASSGLPVTFTCTYQYVQITNNVLKLLYLGVHYDTDVTVTASQGGNEEYNAAPHVSKTLHVIHEE
jgi:ABC-type Fe3+-hydroxamate transport system substrate-binding protein